MNPQLIAAVILSVAGFSCGWFLKGTIKDGEIKTIKLEQATDTAKASQEALTKFVDASKVVVDAAKSAQVDVSAINASLEQIRKDVKNVKTAPLPAGCKPDAPRVRSLAATTDAVDAAIAGPKSGGTVQDQRSPEDRQQLR